MTKTSTYNKHNSFLTIKSNKKVDQESIVKLIANIFNNNKQLLSDYENEITRKAINELQEKDSQDNFSLTQNVIDEISSLDDDEILRYIFHRYRYEIFPKKKILDSYPPYLQIEPSSICNYRCVFCFMTDSSFNNKKNGHMGAMKLELFKDIVDQAEKNIEFISIASRGEPMACKDIDKMLKYCNGKFLNLKINTNASLLNEKKIHSILEGGVKTLVYSADAADKDLYAKLRVNGKLETVLKNIELFNNIKEKHYPKSKIITRVSGVKISEKQKIDDMLSLWKDLVDQVAFVEYNPWENSYDKEPNEITEPCSDLWRRMFVWWDGLINPCDVDYKSVLSPTSILNSDIKNAWTSEKYQKLRDLHLNENRKKLIPCNACHVI
jgi:MoaA/NifB/PqqE/SkfB family radical SAM enzyme